MATGGAERCSALLSNYFHERGHSVHHVIVVDKIDYEYSGEVLNLGQLKNKSNGIFNRIRRFWALRKFFKRHHFDFIIDFRVKRHQLQEFFIAKYIFSAPLIVTVHSYMTGLYFPKNKTLANKIYAGAVKIIAVSKKIEEKIAAKFCYRQLQTIYNPIDFAAIESQNEAVPIEGAYILAVGRMNDQVKQFDKLIESYAQSELPGKNIKLVLLGDGILRQSYEDRARELGLGDRVIFRGMVGNPYAYMKSAKFTVLCSKNEGFPTVLIESLACGTPVVAFDCLSGPAEIIVPDENGILVADQDFGKLVAAVNKMASDTEFYLHCKQNAKSSVADFSLEKIGRQWEALFNSLT